MTAFSLSDSLKPTHIQHKEKNRLYFWMARKEETAAGDFGVKQLPQTTLWAQQLPPTCKIHSPSPKTFKILISLWHQLDVQYLDI